MPFIQNAAAALVGRRTAKRLGRAIPNPILRFALVTAATTLVPLLVNRAVDSWRGRGKGSGQTARA
ncbi:MAG: hypothetical protein H0U67_05295 [Gemmatimonadetes bacterium]|nr:hypothetical protein [Gemmatimonadota bacterium]